MPDELITALADKTAGGAVNVSPSTIETIDRAMHGWLEGRMDIFCNTNKGWKKVPVIWVSAERAYQVKQDKGIRDSSGALVLPIITLQRTLKMQHGKVHIGLTFLHKMTNVVEA